MSPAEHDLARSIRQRLRNRLRERGEDVQLGLQRYAIERFLYRLGLSPHRHRFILKGASLFALWGSESYRPTRDLDFAGLGSFEESEVLEALLEVCRHPAEVEDALRFDAEEPRAQQIRDDSEYQGLRVQLRATLDRSRIPLQIDIGFGNSIVPPPQEAEYPTLLDQPCPRIRAYPREAVVAEKLHAMVVLGERNSRYKDFYDLYVLASKFPFSGSRLSQAVRATFKRRRTEIAAPLPGALTPRYYQNSPRAGQWRAYLTRNSLPGAPAVFPLVGELLERFLASLWHALASRRPFREDWPPGGPWQPATAGGGHDA